MRRQYVPFLAAVAGLVFGVTACGTESGDDGEVQSVGTRAEEMIAGPVAARAGLGDLRPACPDVGAASLGLAFECTAVTEDQRTIKLDAMIDQRGHLDLSTTNVIAAEALGSFEAAAARALNESVRTNLSNEAIDCGDRSVVVGPDQRVLCLVEDPNTGDVFDLTLTISDIEGRQFSLVVGDTPRQP